MACGCCCSAAQRGGPVHLEIAHRAAIVAQPLDQCRADAAARALIAKSQLIVFPHMVTSPTLFCFVAQQRRRHVPNVSCLLRFLPPHSATSPHMAGRSALRVPPIGCHLRASAIAGSALRSSARRHHSPCIVQRRALCTSGWNWQAPVFMSVFRACRFHARPCSVQQFALWL